MKFKFTVVILLFLFGCGLNKEELTKRNDYIYRARVYYRAKKYLNSLQQIEKALEIDPNYKRALIAKAWTLYYLDKNEEAEETFDKAYTLDNSDPWILSGLASIYFKKGLKITDRIFNISYRLEKIKDKSKRETWENDLTKLTKQREELYGKSLDYFELCSKLSPENPDFNEKIAFIYIAEGIKFYPHSITYLDKYLSFIEYEYKGIIKNLKLKEKKREDPGLPQKDKEKLDIIIDSLRLQKMYNRKRYIKIQSLASKVTYSLVLNEYYKIDQAKKEKKPYSKDLFLNYIKESRKRIEKLLKVDKNLPNQYKNLAQLYKLEGNYDKAVQYIRKYIDKFPLANSRERVKAKMELEKIETLFDKTDKADYQSTVKNLTTEF